MSALLDRPSSKEAQPLQRVKRAPRVAGKPKIEPRIQIRARIITRKKSNVAKIALTKCAVFLGVLGLTYTVSSFGGHVMLEGARQERMEANRRAKDARDAEASLSVRLRDVTSAGGIEKWALANNFVAPETQLPKKMEGYVARH